MVDQVVCFQLWRVRLGTLDCLKPYLVSLNNLTILLRLKLSLFQMQPDVEPPPLPPNSYPCYTQCDTTSPDTTYQPPPQQCDVNFTLDTKKRTSLHPDTMCYTQNNNTAGWMDCSYENLQTHGYVTGQESFWETSTTGSLQASYLEDLLQNDLVSAF